MKRDVNGKLKFLECFRCGHSWVIVIETFPKYCPRCRSGWWDIAKRIDKPRWNNKKGYSY